MRSGTSSIGSVFVTELNMPYGLLDYLVYSHNVKTTPPHQELHPLLRRQSF